MDFGGFGTDDASLVLPGGIEGVVWDWGDTLMRDIPGQAGAMVDWPRVEAMPGAALALKCLSALPLQCVATNAVDSDGASVAAALGRVGLRTHLTHFLTSSELGPAKPDPAFFEAVSRTLRVPPSALVSIGNDYAKDIVPAKMVGMATILVSPEGEGPREAADLVVANLVALPERIADR